MFGAFFLSLAYCKTCGLRTISMDYTYDSFVQKFSVARWTVMHDRVEKPTSSVQIETQISKHWNPALVKHQNYTITPKVWLLFMPLPSNLVLVLRKLSFKSDQGGLSHATITLIANCQQLSWRKYSPIKYTWKSHFADKGHSVDTKHTQTRQW